MVKIVGRDESAVRRVTCRDCAAILEYSLSEVKSFKSYDYTGGCDIVHYIDCPNGHKAYVRGY